MFETVLEGYDLEGLESHCDLYKENNVFRFFLHFGKFSMTAVQESGLNRAQSWDNKIIAQVLNLI